MHCERAFFSARNRNVFVLKSPRTYEHNPTLLDAARTGCHAA